MRTDRVAQGMWRMVALEQYVRKGDRPYVEGRMQYDSYERDGVTIPTAHVVVRELVMVGSPGGQRAGVANAEATGDACGGWGPRGGDGKTGGTVSRRWVPRLDVFHRIHRSGSTAPRSDPSLEPRICGETNAKNTAVKRKSGPSSGSRRPC